MTNLPFFKQLAEELTTPRAGRPFGTGWISGGLALLLGLAGLIVVICLHYPSLFTVPQLRFIGEFPWFRPLLHFGLLAAYALALVSLILRQNKILGFTALGVTLLATLPGGSSSQPVPGQDAQMFFGLDFFVINVLLTGLLFVPLERVLPHIKSQTLFRAEWHEDLFYYLVSSLFVQVLGFLTLAPSSTIVAVAPIGGLRAAIAGQPFLLQLVEIMLITDFVQYWLHRAFHRVPFLWRFHAVYHSAKTMDWIAGARMHFIEIIILRAATATPAFALGFEPEALQAYLLLIYVYSTFIHSNFGWNFDWLGRLLVTPRFHHWHHGLEAEAIDVNFAIHFPLYDRLFRTYHLPQGKWPQGYGVGGHPVPRGYWQQFLYPFRKD